MYRAERRFAIEMMAQTEPMSEAIEYVRKAYQRDPEDSDVIDSYARVEYLSGNLREAQRIVRKGGNYYMGNPYFEQLRTAVLGGS